MIAEQGCDPSGAHRRLFCESQLRGLQIVGIFVPNEPACRLVERGIATQLQRIDHHAVAEHLQRLRQPSGKTHDLKWLKVIEVAVADEQILDGRRVDGVLSKRARRVLIEVDQQIRREEVAGVPSSILWWQISCPVRNEIRVTGARTENLQIG